MTSTLFLFFPLLVTGGASKPYSIIVKFKKQVMVADNCYYVDSKRYRHPLKFANGLKRIYFAGPRGQEFILEPNGSSDMKFYSLHGRRNGQQLMMVNDFVLFGQKEDFNNRKVGWIVDLNKDGFFDILQRDKLQIHGKLKSDNLSSTYRNRSLASIRLFKTDVINFRIWDKPTQSYLEKPFYSSKQKEKYYKEFDFKFTWRN